MFWKGGERKNKSIRSFQFDLKACEGAQNGKAENEFKRLEELKCQLK